MATFDLSNAGPSSYTSTNVINLSKSIDLSAYPHPEIGKTVFPMMTRLFGYNRNGSGVCIDAYVASWSITDNVFSMTATAKFDKTEWYYYFKINGTLYVLY